MRKSACEVGVSKSSDEVEPESKASTAVSVSFFEDAPDFQRADDVQGSYAEASQSTVVLFILIAQLSASGFLDRQIGLRVTVY